MDGSFNNNTETRPIIEIDGVRRAYGAFEALKGIDLDIQQGEFFSLLGPSGCGKTTLLRLIAGFDEPTGGVIAIDGAPMAGVSANQRPTNMVFQSYAIFPHLTVGQNVGYGLKKKGFSKDEAKQAVEEALDMVGLGGLGGRAAHELSGGQRQRVALARALVMRPKVLLLDEPLSALDKKMREHMQVELRRLQRQVGITFILVTHDQEEALIMSDRVAVMNGGVIQQLDTPQGLYSRPTNSWVASFIGVMNFFEATTTAELPGGGVTVDIAGLGSVDVAADHIPARMEGLPVTKVGIRPEMLTLLLDDTISAERESTGEVVSTAYYGDMTYYDVKLQGVEDPVTISMRNTAGRRVLEAGDVARVGWGAESVVVLD